MAKAKKKAAKKTTKTAKKAKTGGEVLVVASKVKEYIKQQDMQSSGDVIPALSQKVYDILDAAMARADSNKRRTVRDADL